MNQTDLEIQNALRALGTARWRATSEHRATVTWLISMLSFPVFTTMYGEDYYNVGRMNTSLTRFVDLINSSAAPSALLDKDYWTAAYRKNLLTSVIFERFARRPEEYIIQCTTRMLHPDDFGKLLDEGMPAEYAAEATCLV